MKICNTNTSYLIDSINALKFRRYVNKQANKQERLSPKKSPTVTHLKQEKVRKVDIK